MAYPCRRFVKKRTSSQGLSGITDIPGVDTAINYIKAKVGAFFQLPYEYAQAKKKIPSLIAAAKAKGDTTSVVKLTAINSGVNSLQTGYGAIESKVKMLLDELKSLGFGILPLVVAGLAITVSGAVAYQLVSWGKLKTELNAIEKGTVGEGFFNKPLFGLGIPTWIPLVAVGGIGLWFVMRRK